MYRQLNRRPPIKGLRGVLVVLAIVAAVWLDSLLAQLVAGVNEQVAAILFWGLGVLAALYVLRRFVLGYSYAISSTLLRVSHSYGRYERPMEDIYLNNVVCAGEPEDVARRCPNARVRRAVLRHNPAPVFAVAYRDDGKIRILHLQPDERVRAALEAAGEKPKK